jgi:hypothetical protein
VNSRCPMMAGNSCFTAGMALHSSC